ncbi:MFS transporter [Actinacidiphila acididurans]|uniref:MFS transporter n=1 Tax=Actinacidiphila acididurans TaxID=2784346 RepID=A0ABS2TQP0_9ACTN|nr:MFS transporter [Actinacidiphila acididurans]MBM9505648.1 MFS transporter [Actinacidiphila acididurans]
MTGTAKRTPAPETGERPGGSAARVLWAALLGFFLITLDASVVNVALPAMGRELHGGLSALQWVVDGYTLVFASLMLSTGALSDRIGAGRAFAGGVVVFTVASVACGLAPDLALLIGARVVQGAAASLTLPSSLALVRQAFPDARRRARAISVWATGGATAAALGPVVGGALTTAWSWRAIFFVNLPVGLVALLLAPRAARSVRRPVPLDLPGQVLAVVALGGLTFAVIEQGRAGLAALIAAVLATAGFLVVESRHPHPVVPLSLFRNAAVAVSVAAGSALSVGFYGALFVLSLFFQELRGQSALAAGLMFLPMTGLISTVNVLAGRVAGRYGPRRPMAAGQFLMIAGLLLLLVVGPRTSAPLLAVMMVPLGLGGALAVPPLTAVAMEAVPADRAGLAAGVLNTARQISAGLSIAVFGALVSDPAHFLPGMRLGFLLSAALLALTSTATLLALRQRSG